MLGPTFWYVGLIMSQEPCCDFLENSEIMCQLSKNFGNQDNIVDIILCMKQIFKVSSVGQGHAIVILIRKFGSRNLYVWNLD